MLGQHPALYCLPEVNPFLEASIGASDKILRTVRPRTRDGLLRAIGQLEFGGQTDDHITQAEAWINARYDWTPVQLMGYFSTRLAPKIVIEKSPSTVLVRKAFDRALDLFPDAHYLHLYRHPIPTTKSIATITGHNGKTADRKRRANDPETSWYDVNAQIVEMTARLAPGQVMSMSFWRRFANGWAFTAPQPILRPCNIPNAPSLPRLVRPAPRLATIQISCAIRATARATFPILP